MPGTPVDLSVCVRARACIYMCMCMDLISAFGGNTLRIHNGGFEWIVSALNISPPAALTL